MMSAQWTLPAAVLTAAAVVVSCASGTETGTAPTATAAPEPDVSLMDTGPYAVTASRPFGTVGDNPNSQGVLESQRIAEVTVGPWSVSPKFTLWGTEFNIVMTGRLPTGDALRWQLPEPDRITNPLPDIATRNGMLGGFTAQRVAQVGDKPSDLAVLQNMVLRFPDDPRAAAAAAEMAAADPGPTGASTPGQRVALPGEPEAQAASYQFADGATMVRSFTPHGPYLLYQSTSTPARSPIGLDAINLAGSALAAQKKLLNTFTPTPVDRLAGLPLDPSGYLLARTLNGPGDSTPSMIGVWAPRAWVAFENDPPAAAAMLSDAGVDWVSQRLATVYQATNPDTAEELLGKVVTALRMTPSARPTAAVPGLPRARCFERPEATELDDAPQDWQRVFWHFKCAAAVDRYVFTVYAADGRDAMQRISAQWRILAGK